MFLINNIEKSKVQPGRIGKILKKFDKDIIL